MIPNLIPMGTRTCRYSAKLFATFVIILFIIIPYDNPVEMLMNNFSYLSLLTRYQSDLAHLRTLSYFRLLEAIHGNRSRTFRVVARTNGVNMQADSTTHFEEWYKRSDKVTNHATYRATSRMLQYLVQFRIPLPQIGVPLSMTPYWIQV